MALNDQELTSTTPETTPPAGQALADDAAPQSSSSEQAQKQSVNLFELPEFRAYQAQVARTQAQERQAYDARVAQLEQRMVQAEESGLDDFEKAQRQIQRYQQQLAAIQQNEQQRQAQAAEQQAVLNDMQLISRKTGIPVDRLFKAQTLEQAWDMGFAYRDERQSKSAQEQEEKRAAHLPDMGQGKAPGPSSRLEQELAKAETSVDFARILRQAGRNSRP